MSLSILSPSSSEEEYDDERRNVYLPPDSPLPRFSADLASGKIRGMGSSQPGTFQEDDDDDEEYLEPQEEEDPSNVKRALRLFESQERADKVAVKKRERETDKLEAKISERVSYLTDRHAREVERLKKEVQHAQRVALSFKEENARLITTIDEMDKEVDLLVNQQMRSEVEKILKRAAWRARHDVMREHLMAKNLSQRAMYRLGFFVSQPEQLFDEFSDPIDQEDELRNVEVHEILDTTKEL